MEERIMFICGGFGCGNPDITQHIELQLMSFLEGENLKGEMLIEDPDLLAEKMIENPNAAFIFVDTKVPGSIYNYFANDPEGFKMIQIYNITLGYLNMAPFSVDKLVYCLNRTGKIHLVARPPKKQKTSRKRRVS